MSKYDTLRNPLLPFWPAELSWQHWYGCFRKKKNQCNTSFYTFSTLHRILTSIKEILAQYCNRSLGTEPLLNLFKPSETNDKTRMFILIKSKEGKTKQKKPPHKYLFKQTGRSSPQWGHMDVFPNTNDWC